MKAAWALTAVVMLCLGGSVFGDLMNVSTPTFTPDGGIYASEQTVVIDCDTPGASIYYTTDGSDPNMGTLIGAGSSVFIDHSLTLRAVAHKDGLDTSAGKTAIYQLVTATPDFSPGGGIYSQIQYVVITCATPGATIHYTTNGSDPTESDPIIASGSSVFVGHSLTLKAKAWKDSMTPSAVRSAPYQMVTATPSFSPGAGTYHAEQNVVITCATPYATIRYTIDGSDPNEGTVIASGSSVFVDHSLTLKAKAWIFGFTPSGVQSADYHLVTATPEFTPGGGLYSTEQNVVITCATPGATIHYTTNGSDPTESDPIIASGSSIFVDHSLTLKAKAWIFGFTPSDVQSADYQLVTATPEFTPDGGVYMSDPTVVIDCNTPGAVIYYTTDGSEPDEGDSVIESGGSLSVPVNPATTLKAKAFKAGFETSDVKTAVYRSPVVVYVNNSSTGANNGSSWADAYTSLETALSAEVNCDEIWVAAGTYDAPSGGFQLKNGVAVYGGFAGYETYRDERNWQGNAVILSGNYTDRVFYHPEFLALNNTAVLDGVTVANGCIYSEVWDNQPVDADTAAGGGMYNDSCSPTIRNCIFYNNKGEGSVKYFTGFDLNSYPGDHYLGFGGGVYNHNSDPVIENCMFIQNTALVGGAGIENDASSPVITNCVFYLNSADESYYSSGNYSEHSIACGIGNKNGSCPVITNCTIAANVNAYSITNTSDSHPIITNSILWDTTAIYNLLSSSCTVSYSDIREGYAGAGNINLDPQFLSTPDLSLIPDWDALSLTFGSPCIDLGNNAAVPAGIAADILGEFRIVDGNNDGQVIVDMGTYEVNPYRVALPVFSPDGGAYGTDRTVTITCDTAGATIRYTTDGSDPEQGIIIPNGGSIIVTVNPKTTLKSQAFKTGWDSSFIKTAEYLKKYDGGSGTESDPFLISTVAKFYDFIYNPADWNKHFKLAADIDFAGEVFTEAVIAPDISTNNEFQGTVFTGTFDGDGYTISNLTITAPTKYHIGLFGYIGPSGGIKNLGLENANIIGARYIGGLAGQNNGTITSCYATGSVRGIYYVGGLVGVTDSGTITSCYATGSVRGSCVGGLVGYHSGTIASCYASGPVSGIYYIGGLIGGKFSSSAVTDCFWDTETSGVTVSAGGTGKTTAEMMSLATFTSAGWDFSDTDGDPADWVMPSMDYPKLAWQDRVGLEDFKLLAQYWQMTGCTAGQPCAAADWYADGSIDLLDLDILAENWLSASILKDYPPIYWPMDDAVDNADVIDSVGIYPGVFHDASGNATTETHHSADCREGTGSLSFDGVDDYVDISGYKGILGTASRTCMAWIKTSGAGHNMVIMDWGAAVSGQQWLFGMFSSGTLCVYAGGPYIQTNATVTDGQWHHVTAVLVNDGSPSINEVKLYIDGALQAVSTSGTDAINTVAGPDVVFGAVEAAGGGKAAFYPGLLDDVRIYNTALTDGQIQAVFLEAGAD